MSLNEAEDIPSQIGTQPVIPANLLETMQPLDLCDCHFVDSSEGNSVKLSCQRDGFFIAGFHAAGYVSGHASELLPLSPAICCRPCLPQSTEEEDKPVAVISTNCHEAKLTSQEQCGVSGAATDGFLQGFEKGQIGTPTSYYPDGVAQCCEPLLLLESGKVKSLVRCLCDEDSHSPAHVTCATRDTPMDASADKRLIWGFQHVHDIYGHYPVPSAHAKCCRVCIDHSKPSQDPQRCEGLNFCSGHGECIFGRCECKPGYSGLECDVKGSRKSGLPSRDSNAWMMSMIVVSGCLLGCCSRLLLCVCRRRHILPNGHPHNQDLEQPMLRPDESTSSAEEWSTDTDDDQFEDQQSLAHQTIRQAPAGAAQAAAAAHLSGTPRGGSVDNFLSTHLGGDSGGEDAAPSAAAASPAEVESEEETGVSEGEEVTHRGGEGGGQASGETPPPPPPLASDPVEVVQAGGRATQNMECLVCMSSPIQVVCVPCGHACMCRKCSRRLRRCPLCRNEVTRRQKLFLGI